jgi:hypothetical protein
MKGRQLRRPSGHIAYRSRLRARLRRALPRPGASQTELTSRDQPGVAIAEEHQMGVQLRSGLEADMDRPHPASTPRSRSRVASRGIIASAGLPGATNGVLARDESIRRWRCRTSRSPLFACDLLDFISKTVKSN